MFASFFFICAHQWLAYIHACSAEIEEINSGYLFTFVYFRYFHKVCKAKGVAITWHENHLEISQNTTTGNIRRHNPQKEVAITIRWVLTGTLQHSVFNNSINLSKNAKNRPEKVCKNVNICKAELRRGNGTFYHRKTFEKGANASSLILANL